MAHTCKVHVVLSGDNVDWTWATRAPGVPRLRAREAACPHSARTALQTSPPVAPRRPCLCQWQPAQFSRRVKRHLRSVPWSCCRDAKASAAEWTQPAQPRHQSPRRECAVPELGRRTFRFTSSTATCRPDCRSQPRHRSPTACRGRLAGVVKSQLQPSSVRRT